MPRLKNRATAGNNSQLKRFVESARALSCDESEERFDAALAKVARHKPPDRAEPKRVVKKNSPAE